LGEYERDQAVVRRDVERLGEAASAMAAAGLEVHLSVDPTQIGHLASSAFVAAQAKRLAAAVRTSAPPPGSGVLMLDIEDDSLVDDTLALHGRLMSVASQREATECAPTSRSDVAGGPTRPAGPGSVRATPDYC
jgi:proline dehydrogenase